MRIAIAGASGLVGSALCEALALQGDDVIRLARGGTAAAGEIRWSPEVGAIEGEKLEGLDAVVCLSGESIASGRWTENRKGRIRESRVNSVRLLSETMAALSAPPPVLVCASAVGYYGGGDSVAIADESNPSGDDFLAGVCVDWEKAAETARAAGIRVAHVRMGVVLSAKGGALASMLMPFRLGLGGVLGGGEQRMSWIALPDLVKAFIHVMEDESIRGPVNAVSPGIVTNREFTKTLGKVLGRPTVLPVPRLLLKAILGEMGEALLLADVAVRPSVLLGAGYAFGAPGLESALRRVVSR